MLDHSTHSGSNHPPHSTYSTGKPVVEVLESVVEVVLPLVCVVQRKQEVDEANLRRSPTNRF